RLRVRKYRRSDQRNCGTGTAYDSLVVSTQRVRPTVLRTLALRTLKLAASTGECQQPVRCQLADLRCEFRNLRQCVGEKRGQALFRSTCPLASVDRGPLRAITRARMAVLQPTIRAF